MAENGTKTLLMTKGPIHKLIINFTLPILIGQIFQQLYNIMDALVVGNFLGHEALAAVSSSGSLIMFFVGFFVGIFNGAGVIVAKYYGAENAEKVRKSVHNNTMLAVCLGIFISIMGVFFSPIILKIMGTPENVLDDSTLYLRTYFFGAVFVCLYNSSTGVCQAVGDSRRPLYYLIISSMTNVVLDILFVAIFKFGIAGAAWATVISQAVGSFMVLRRLIRTDDVIKLSFKYLHFDFPILKEIIRTGIPSGIQNSLISFSNVVVQSTINTFGDFAMAGFGSSIKVQGFVFIPVVSISLAISTFVGQNLGAHEYDRAKKGAWFGIGTCFILAEIIGVINFFVAPHLIALFNGEPEVVIYGAQHARTLCLFYGVMSFTQCASGVMRGSGRAFIPMLVMLCTWCLARIIFVKTVIQFINDISVVFWAYPLTWIMSSLILLVPILRGKWVHGLENKKERLAH